jgi:hypothetical protein
VTAIWTHLLNGLTGLSLVRRAVNALFGGQAQQHLAQLDRRPVRRVQLRTLLALLRRAAGTPFGIHHDFPRIRTLADFHRLVPLRTPLELAREIEHTLRLGTAGAIASDLPATPRLPRWPGGPNAGQRQVLRTALSLAARTCPRGRLLGGLALVLGPESRPTIRGTDLVRCLPPLVRPYARTHLGPDRHGNDDPIAALAEQHARDEVSCLIGSPQGMLSLIERVKRIRAQDQLERVWPHLSAVLCLQTDSEPIPARLQAELGGVPRTAGSPVVVQTLLRPEGPIAIRDPRHQAWRLLTDHGSFFEFLPAEQAHERSVPRLGFDEIEPGRAYEIALSAPTGPWGVWACRIGLRLVFEEASPLRQPEPRPPGSGTEPRPRGSGDGDGPPLLRELTIIPSPAVSGLPAAHRSLPPPRVGHRQNGDSRAGRPESFARTPWSKPADRG